MTSITVESQARLSAVLRYLYRGNYSLFLRSCDMSGVQVNKTDRYQYGNLLMALRVAGIVEADQAEGTISWSYAADGDVAIQSLRPKRIPLMPSAVLDAFRHDCRPLITDDAGVALLQGMANVSDINEANIVEFGPALLERIPSLKEVDSLVCAEEALRLDGASNVEVFDLNAARWQPVGFDEVIGDNLIRLRRRYSGTTYYISLPDGFSYLKISDPDWAFPMAMNVLGWRLERFISGDSTIKFPRAFRLPIILLRFIFANAASMRIGAQLSFVDVHPDAVSRVVAYFS
jgi:hypothetical protein